MRIKNPYHVPPLYDAAKSSQIKNWLAANPDVATISVEEARARFPAFFGSMDDGGVQQIFQDALQLIADEKNATGATATREVKTWSWLDFIV